jgi:hypothetical protein
MSGFHGGDFWEFCESRRFLFFVSSLNEEHYLAAAMKQHSL